MMLIKIKDILIMHIKIEDILMQNDEVGNILLMMIKCETGRSWSETDDQTLVDTSDSRMVAVDNDLCWRWLY